MSRVPVTETIGGLKVRCTPMPLGQSELLIPEVVEFVGIVLRELAKGVAGLKLEDLDIDQVGATLLAGGGYLGGGRLARLAPKIFGTCAVALPDVSGVLEWKELSKEADRERVLDERPDVYFPLLFFAGRVTFARFFPRGLFAPSPGGPGAGAADRPGEETPAPSS